ncbi:UNVERIFIED_CONTAM: hypothetical protein K2H54_003083 [Gekko kuhli]
MYFSENDPESSPASRWRPNQPHPPVPQKTSHGRDPVGLGMKGLLRRRGGHLGGILLTSPCQPNQMRTNRRLQRAPLSLCFPATMSHTQTHTHTLRWLPSTTASRPFPRSEPGDRAEGGPGQLSCYVPFCTATPGPSGLRIANAVNCHFKVTVTENRDTCGLLNSVE